MTDKNNISIVTELYGNRGLCWNAIDGFQSFILIQKQKDLVIGDRVICNELVSQESTSTAIAVASPPPMQRLATPRVLLYFLRADISVTIILVPDAPTGCPNAQAPP